MDGPAPSGTDLVDSFQEINRMQRTGGAVGMPQKQYPFRLLPEQTKRKIGADMDDLTYLPEDNDFSFTLFDGLLFSPFFDYSDDSNQLLVRSLDPIPHAEAPPRY